MTDDDKLYRFKEGDTGLPGVRHEESSQLDTHLGTYRYLDRKGEDSWTRAIRSW